LGRSSRILWALAQAHAGPATVVIDEFNAGRFESASDDGESGLARLTAAGLELVHRYHAHGCLLSELLLAPCQQAAGGPALFRGDHGEELARAK
jgi:hypothetical protein